MHSRTLVATTGLLALVLSGCGDTSPHSRAVSVDVAAKPHPKTYAENRRAAAKESRRVVGLVPVPPGSTRLSKPPKSWSGSPDITEGPSDPRLTRTAWWSVPGDADAIQAYLKTHHPIGLLREDGVGGGSDGIRYLDYGQRMSADPAAYLPVALQVMWGPSKTQDGRLIVRADTFTAARAVRDPRSRISGPVAGVDIRQVRSFRGGHTRRLPAVHLTSRHDRTAIEQLVRSVNGLQASIRPTQALPCPYPPQPSPRVALTFHVGAHGSHGVTMRLADWCFGQVQTTRDGRPVHPTLDPGDLVSTVDHVTRRQAPRG